MYLFIVWNCCLIKLIIINNFNLKYWYEDIIDYYIDYYLD